MEANLNVTPPHFHLFPQLPSELRLKIYHCILFPSHFTNPSSPHKPPATQRRIDPDKIHSEPHVPAYRSAEINDIPLPRCRILKLSYTRPLQRYISNIPPPVLLSVTRETRAYTLETYSTLSIGSSSYPIPISYSTDTLYLSNLLPLLGSPTPSTLIYSLSTTPARHKIQSLALDLRLWHDMYEEGLLAMLAGMRGLKELNLVVEFGRREFKGEVGFLRVPEWRRDLMWSAGMAKEVIEKERGRRGMLMKGERVLEGGRAVCRGEDGGLKVRCVILTRGGEQA
jgi:hypothetical protein